MSVTLKLANVWRVLRDVNLDAIRTAAEARFVLPIVADVPEDADAIRTLLGGSPTNAPHPWLVTAQAVSALPTLPVKPLFGVLVTRQPTPSPALHSAREAFARDGIGVLTVVVADEAGSTVPAADEVARIVAPAIDSALVRDLAAALVRLAGHDWRLALARQLSALREPVIAALIEETAQANASYALATGLAEVVPVLNAPMNLGDMIVLTKNQLVMSYRIALACGLDGDARRLIPEILGVLGGGLLFRQLARQLIGLIPAIGIAPKVAVAYGGTYAIGRAITAWATEGREVSAEAVHRFSREGLARGRELAKTLLASARTAQPVSRRWDALRRSVPAVRRPRD